MTHHYNIEIVKTSTHLKATYRDKKFRKLEHLRGKLDRTMMRELGRIIPVHEDDFSSFNKAYIGKVHYQIIVTEKSLYSKFLDEWYLFYQNTFKIQPKFSGADGKALKGIISYLQKLGTNDEEALTLWNQILTNWHLLSKFHKANTDLKYINSKLNIIINAIKQESKTYSNTTNGTVEL